MIHLLNELATYLGEKLEMTPGENVFYNSMPDQPDECVLIQEPSTHIPVPAQVDASTHYLRITARAKTDVQAFQLAGRCYKWFVQDREEYRVDEIANTELTGFLDISENITVFIQPYGTPIWDKTDQRGRRYYFFTASLITKRIL